jgi:membrane fusion protein, multidrug efflux system
MIKRLTIMLLATGLVFGAVFGFQIFKAKMIEQAMAALANPPQTVSATTAQTQEWQPQIEAVGSVRAVNGANLSSQVPGIVSAIHFESDKDVTQDTLLLELQAADDIAHLESLKATTELSRITYERDSKLVKSSAVSQQTVDTDLWTWKSNEALVAQQQALVNYKSIKAPFSGRIGIRQVDLGQYLAAGTTIVTLQQLDPIYVDFYLPQQSLAAIRVGQGATAKVDTFPGDTFDGEISAINSLVDVATRNIQVRATFKNPAHKLLPGMFAAVNINAGASQHYVTLPQTAIAYNSYGNIVYLVDDKGQGQAGQPQLFARQTFVTTGATRGDQVAVLKGVNAGDTVVTAGQIKLRNGSPIVINNSVQPSNDANPKPVDR